MPPETAVSELAQLIQISIAPVFLLTGIGSLLSVMTNRLARIIDRARILESPAAEVAAGVNALALEELRTLRARIGLINRAIGLCTYSALLVAGVIAALFVGSFIRVDVHVVVAVAFAAAALLLIGGLLSFLAEVHVATRYMRAIGRQR